MLNSNQELEMKIVTPDLCDEFPEFIQVVEPMFNNYGGKKAFGGQIVTVKCFEDNSIVKEQVARPGKGKVMVVDGGGSLRAALLGDMLAEKAAENQWEGIIVYGCIRDVDVIAATNLGVQALRTHPMKTDKRGIGDLDVVVTFGGVTFKPGQFVYADNNGIIVSSKDLFV
jgi:regulator of ribonuclease activity A